MLHLPHVSTKSGGFLVRTPPQEDFDLCKRLVIGEGRLIFQLLHGRTRHRRRGGLGLRHRRRNGQNSNQIAWVEHAEDLKKME